MMEKHISIQQFMFRLAFRFFFSKGQFISRQSLIFSYLNKNSFYYQTTNFAIFVVLSPPVNILVTDFTNHIIILYFGINQTAKTIKMVGTLTGPCFFRLVTH